mmetsp:Transcript_1059/g.3135  ORF Transcript_1059/g.3135 Transcript_1059/m.3135 type:complete len:366 (+) Transcript_1059:796-1893(+)
MEDARLLLLVEHLLEPPLRDPQQHALRLERLLLVVVLNDHATRGLHFAERANLLVQRLQGLGQLGPRADGQPRLHVLQLRQANLDLGRRRLRPETEDLQHKPIAVKDVNGRRQLASIHALLVPPRLCIGCGHGVGEDVLQVPGLRWRERRVHEDEPAGVLGDVDRQLRDLALAEEGVRGDLAHLDYARLGPLPPNDRVLPGLLLHVQLVVALLLAAVQMPALGRQPGTRGRPAQSLAVLRLDQGVRVPAAARLGVRPRQEVPAVGTGEVQRLLRVEEVLGGGDPGAGAGDDGVDHDGQGLRPVEPERQGVLVGKAAGDGQTVALQPGEGAPDPPHRLVRPDITSRVAGKPAQRSGKLAQASAKTT